MTFNERCKLSVFARVNQSEVICVQSPNLPSANIRRSALDCDKQPSTLTKVPVKFYGDSIVTFNERMLASSSKNILGLIFVQALGEKDIIYTSHQSRFLCVQYIFRAIISRA